MSERLSTLRWLETAPDAHGREWQLTDGVGTLGSVQQFYSDHPYYGTWADGRSGPMTELEDCKKRVENAVRPN